MLPYISVRSMAYLYKCEVICKRLGQIHGNQRPHKVGTRLDCSARLPAPAPGSSFPAFLRLSDFARNLSRRSKAALPDKAAERTTQQGLVV